jgi:inosine/xanthosine triphosphate pyrophosphatase family protein
VTRKQIEILIATGNEGKAREIRCALTRLPLTIRTLRDFPSVQEIEETGETYEENAISKAVGYSAQTGLYAIADDSGMEVIALDGRPGFFFRALWRNGDFRCRKKSKTSVVVGQHRQQPKDGAFCKCRSLGATRRK